MSASPESCLQRAWPAVAAFVAFAILALISVRALKSQNAPWPVYMDLVGDNPEQLFEFGQDPLFIRFNAPADHLRGVHFRVLNRDPKHRIRLSAVNESSPLSLGSTDEIGYGLDATLEFIKPVKKGDRIQVKFELLDSPKDVAPSVKKMKASKTPILPELDLTTNLCSEAVDGFPQMILLYQASWKPLLWLWIVVGLSLPLVLWIRPTIWPWLIFLGFCALLTSWLGWQQRISNHYGNFDPDRYGQAANFMADWWRNPSDRPQMEEQLHKYQHAHVALVPAALTVLMIAGMEMHDAYLLFNALISFATLLLIQQLLSRQLRLSWPISTIGTLLFACHFIFLRTFARPTTDQAGLFLVTAMLCLLVARSQRRSFWNTLGLALLVAPLILVRPPGFVYAAFLIGMAPFCDWIREKRFMLVDHILTVAKIAVIPGLFIAWLYVECDLAHNFGLAYEKRKDHIGQWTLEWFRIAMIAAVQILVIGWFFLRWKPGTWRPIVILGLWAVLHTLLLVASQAPFLPRLMGPILPSLIALTCFGLDRFRENRLKSSIAVGAMIALAIVNVLILIWTINLPYFPKPPLNHYFYL
ncbi:MAG: hypothetical protein ACI8UO_002081 [Verrucomicrobiales bacterium]|jgi:hypothetical protein